MGVVVVGTDKTSLGDRMKGYENVNRQFLTRRTPAILRVDGKAFHTKTKHLEKPFDKGFFESMLDVAWKLCEEIQGSKLAYIQSDEISVLFTDYDKLTTSAWFDKNIQKIVSVSASIATATFKHFPDANFDSRTFVLPKEEVCNYFLWRQQDASRNSINSLAQAHFSHKRLQNLNTDQVQELLFQEKSINWANLPTWQKRGTCVVYKETDWMTDWEIPLFSADRAYINQYVFLGEI